MIAYGEGTITRVAEALQWAAESEKDDVVAYFDPDDSRLPKRKMRYIISVPSGYYEIEYGLVKGGGRGG